MDNLRVEHIDQYSIKFNDNVSIFCDHEQDCCESHELYLKDLELNMFDGLRFDLTDDNFFKRIEGDGIELIPTNGRSIRIAGHGSNNGYYSENLSLIVKKDGVIIKRYDITECQDVSEY